MTSESPRLDDITEWAPASSCNRLQMLRLDLIHPVVSGNKWFKLSPYIATARSAGARRLLSFGGGWSNHLVALAFAAREAGLSAVGVIRGHYDPLTPSLEHCIALGMQLKFISGSEYVELKDGLNPRLSTMFPEHFIIPEGGASEWGIAGAAAIGSLIPARTDVACVPVGTGTTIAGIERQLPPDADLIGFCAARDCSGAISLLQNARHPGRCSVLPVHDPRFGRWRPELIRFMQGFFSQTGIRLDVVYTGKMMERVSGLLQSGALCGKRIVCVHTGGIQGNPPGLFTTYAP